MYNMYRGRLAVPTRGDVPECRKGEKGGVDIGEMSGEDDEPARTVK
jgi:hypothetical protein